MVLMRYWLPFMAPCFGIISRLIKSNGKTRVLCLADNIVPHEQRPGDKLLTQFFMQSIDGMVVMTKSVQEDALQFRKDLPVELSPHPVFDNYGPPVDREEAIRKLGLAVNFRYLLFFGFIREYKGLDWLLEAMGDSKIKSLPVKLIVAGEFYTDDQVFLELIQRNGLEDSVIFKSDYIPDEEVSLYFGASDLVVQPYKHATQSGVTQIAYHFKKSMLVTNVGGLPEMIPDQIVGYVVEPSVKAVTDAIVDFFESDRKTFFENNIGQEMEKYRWDKMVDAFVRLYDKCK
ncbi:MAG TPA: glycosyl transferase family 1 [Saprospirales bacterium]|nr:glycosyl transferase family 1 [Saprospirales bacterium]